MLSSCGWFYDWRRDGVGKVPVWFHLKKKEPFAFAGFWDMWRDTDGEMLYTFTIVTTVPNALVRRIHHRMPVIFDDSSNAVGGPRLSTRNPDIAAVLAPFPSELMESYDVSPLVNKTEIDSSDCINPVRAAPLIWW